MALEQVEGGGEERVGGGRGQEQVEVLGVGDLSAYPDEVVVPPTEDELGEALPVTGAVPLQPSGGVLGPVFGVQADIGLEVDAGA